MKKRTINFHFFCDDCNYLFQTFIPKPNAKKLHCPNCGDNIAVRPYESEKNEKNERVIIPWSAEELELIQQIIDGKLKVFQAAIMMGRTANSVAKKAQKTRKAQRIERG